MAVYSFVIGSIYCSAINLIRLIQFESDYLHGGSFMVLFHLSYQYYHNEVKFYK